MATPGVLTKGRLLRSLIALFPFNQPTTNETAYLWQTDDHVDVVDLDINPTDSYLGLLGQSL